MCLDFCRICGSTLARHDRSLFVPENNNNGSFPALLHSLTNRDGSPEVFSDALCQKCWLSVSNERPVVGLLPLQPDGADSPVIAVSSGGPYNVILKKLIHRFKYKEDRLLAHDLAAIAMNAWSALPGFTDCSNLVVVPVPLHSLPGSSSVDSTRRSW